MKKLFKRKTAVVGLLITVAVILMAIFAPYVAPHDPEKVELALRLKPPFWLENGSLNYPLGTDSLGRDVLSRIIFGSQKSILVSFLATVISCVLGVILGLISGYYGGTLDTVITRLGDIQLAFPLILLSIAVIAVLGASTLNLIIVFGIANWVVYARVARGAVLSVKEKEYVEGSRAAGCSDSRIIIYHIFPNICAPIIVIATLSLAGIIISESSLSFLGLGVPPPKPTWGGMLSEGRQYLYDGWWVATFPGLAIMLTVLGVNLFGDGLRDAYDPKLSTEKIE
ncbi:ABC transporter permease [Metallumcola ferriviriculae]|uniref:ABC transporter permease n=1 Tax=Metallumcola ferriviriculae TaxID=3039180 RepID=A0AAU0UNX2_9FIRM|nr:ABC transporter permease [Desulfitibacteraceae bacterium MK1]